ncbi:hypoxanthine phosphoribosyltransferase [Roseimaritima sediminicola]|uniref:hypoxanthine phosphoribosyltransferase n=1 Tax=Roseimaritima sediminicola TaxID=2662066 RepID=UPI0012983D53|nr:hypoxanthine phosphoribosyltransferase [Roseimaritima sediminicola]
MRVLFDESQLLDGVRRLAAEIDAHYQGRPLTVVAVMTGSVVLFADLIRMLSMPLRVGVIQASSYRGGVKSGELTVDTQMLLDIKGRDVLLVDDIFDTGRTLERLVQIIQQRGASSVKSAMLLRKRRQHDVAIQPDFVAFEIPDEFVVGYGLDYRDMYRNLPYLAILDEEEIARGAEPSLESGVADSGDTSNASGTAETSRAPDSTTDRESV